MLRWPLRLLMCAAFGLGPAAGCRSLPAPGEELTPPGADDPDEFEGELGHLAGAALIPLGALGKRQDELQRDRPVVTVCRSGGRSAQAAVMLQQAGFPRVANLAGGMLRWHAERNTVDGGGI